MDLGSLTRLPQTFRNIGRARQILGVLGRHGFADVLARVGLEGASQLFLKIITFNRFRPDVGGHSTEERIRRAMEQLGPAFVKLGQLLAARPDLVPLSLVQELKKLEDRVPPFPGAEAKAEIEAELGKPMAEVFSAFDQEPLAAGSIAQVHAATLKTGEKVVVKVRRPGLERLLRTDLDIMARLATLLEEHVPESRIYHPKAIVAEFARSITGEIDFTREMFNMRKFARQTEKDARFSVPRVYPDFCTRKLLVVERVDGIKITNIEALRTAGIDPSAVARNGIQWILLQIFTHGFFHADPHAGNLFVLPGGVICLVDFGLMGSVDDERLDELLAFMAGVVGGDADRLIRAFRRMGILDDEVDLRSLRVDARDLVERFGDMPLGKVDTAKFFAELYEVLSRHHIRVPVDVHLLGKALATSEGIARQLDPGLDILAEIRPFVIRAYLGRLARFRSLSRQLRRTTEDWTSLLKSFPSAASRILTQLRDGEFEFAAHIRDQERLVRDGNRSSNRVAVGLIMAGLVIASSILVVVARGPAFYGVSITELLGALGYLAAGTLGLSLFAAMWRSGGI